MRGKKRLGIIILVWGICLITGCQSKSVRQNATEDTTAIIETDEAISEQSSTAEAEDEDVEQTLEDEDICYKLFLTKKSENHKAENVTEEVQKIEEQETAYTENVPEAVIQTEKYYISSADRLGITFSYEYSEEDNCWECAFAYEDIVLYEKYGGTNTTAMLEYAGEIVEVPWDIPVTMGTENIICQKRDITGDGYEELLVWVDDIDFNNIYYIYDLKNGKDISPFYSAMYHYEDRNFSIMSIYMYEEYGSLLSSAITDSLTELGREAEAVIGDFRLGSDPIRYETTLTEDNRIVFEYLMFTNGTEWVCELTFKGEEDGLVVENVDMATRFQTYRDAEYQGENILASKVYFEKGEESSMYHLEFYNDELKLTASLKYGSINGTTSLILEYEGNTIKLEDWYVGSWDIYGYFEMEDMDGDGNKELVQHRRYPEYVRKESGLGYDRIEIEETKIYDLDTLTEITKDVPLE